MFSRLSVNVVDCIIKDNTAKAMETIARDAASNLDISSTSSDFLGSLGNLWNSLFSWNLNLEIPLGIRTQKFPRIAKFPVKEYWRKYLVFDFFCSDQS